MEESNTSQEPQIQINEPLVRANIEKLKLEQNLGLGIIGGTVGGFIGAVTWAAITYFTESQIGLLAIGVGFLVGLGVSKLGKGLDKIFGIIGGIIALVSVVLGNFLATLGFLAKALEISYTSVILNFNYALTFELMKETFSASDLLFYGIAIYAGYRYSFRQVNQDELLKDAIIETK